MLGSEFSKAILSSTASTGVLSGIRTTSTVIPKITLAAQAITTEQYADLRGATPRAQDALTRLDLSKDFSLDALCI